MKICLDCTPFLVRSAGVKAYLYYLNHYLHATAEGREIVCFPFLSRPGSLRHDASTLGGFASRARPRSPLASTALESYLQMGGHRADLFHASIWCAMCPQNRPDDYVHDLTSFLLPEMHTRQTIRAIGRSSPASSAAPAM